MPFHVIAIDEQLCIASKFIETIVKASEPGIHPSSQARNMHGVINAFFFILLPDIIARKFMPRIWFLLMVVQRLNLNILHFIYHC